MKLLYFTSTGNNLYIAEFIGGELLSISQLIKTNQFKIEDDTVGIIFPVYYYSVPQIVKDYLSKVKIRCNYLFTITSYGSAEIGALRALKICNKILENNNLKVNYSNSVLMIDNFLPLYDVEKEIKIKNDEMIDEKLQIIRKDIQNKKDFQLPRNIIGDLIFSDSLIKIPFTRLFKLEVVEDKCVNCKVCVKVCPKENIVLGDFGPIIGEDCEFCLGCVHHCKKHAIKTNKEKSSARFRNPHVPLSKIIKSNK